MYSSSFFIKISGGCICILLVIFFISTKKNSENEFWDFFKDSKLSLSRNGLIPAWGGDLLICVYGEKVNETTKNALLVIQKSISYLPYIDLKIDWKADINNCHSSTNVFLWLQEGDVFRVDVENNYLNSLKISGVKVNINNKSLYQSAFAQTAFLSDGNNAVVAILINQITSEPSGNVTRYLKANILEEIFQTITIANDMNLHGEMKSILQEKFIHTPSIWSGTYDEGEVTEYLKYRPQGICLWDVKMLVLLYGMEYPSSSLKNYKRILKNSEFEKKVMEFSEILNSNELYDVECGNNI